MGGIKTENHNKLFRVSEQNVGWNVAKQELADQNRLCIMGLGRFNPQTLFVLELLMNFQY